MTTHQCSLSLMCKSNTCSHAKPHLPNDCDCTAPCGNWPSSKDFKPMVKCIPEEKVKPVEDCPNCGTVEAKGHHPADCVQVLKRRLEST